jgi:hypothetical protein
MSARREWLLARSAFAAALTVGTRSGFEQGAQTLKVEGDQSQPHRPADP